MVACRMRCASGIAPLARFLFLCWMAACASAPSKESGSELADTSWQLIRFQGNDDTLLTPDDGSKYTIAFGADGRVAARIDCNRGNGTWTSAGPSLVRFGPLALTRAKCPPGSLHDRIVRNWEGPTSSSPRTVSCTEPQLQPMGEEAR